MSAEVERYAFTVAEFERMGEAGILRADARVELIEGEVVEMSPIGSRHAACVGRLTQILIQLLQGRAIVWVQNPIRLGEYSEPQPDIALLKPRADFYEHAHPAAEDVLLVVEVADTTLQYDRQIKLPMYARARVPEVWIVNLVDELIETFARPSDEAYELMGRGLRGEELGAAAAQGLRLRVSDILG
jgi:Uma2 family endonuclease